MKEAIQSLDRAASWLKGIAYFCVVIGGGTAIVCLVMILSVKSGTNTYDTVVTACIWGIVICVSALPFYAGGAALRVLGWIARNTAPKEGDQAIDAPVDVEQTDLQAPM